MIPGSNLLNQAFSLISQQSVSWYKFSGRLLNDIGFYEDTYELPLTITGSLQPVDKSVYQDYGLDFKKSYFRFYTSNNVLGLDRDYSGDRFIYNNINFAVSDEIEWRSIDGWNSVLLVKAPLDNQNV